MTLKNFLVIENNNEIFNFKFEFNSILMWPFIRFYIYKKLLSKENRNINSNILSLKRYTFYDNVTYIKNIISNNPYKKYSKKYDILMFCSGITNIKRGNKYFNRVNDYFAFIYKDKTLLIEDSNKRKYYIPRFFPNICYHDFIILNSYIKSKFGKVSKKDIITIKNLLNFLKTVFNEKLQNSDLNIIENSLLSLSKKLRIYNYLYNKLFDKYNPKVIFLEDASYGSRSYILKWAKERGILTIELQHGVLYNNHPAYNYGKSILDSNIYKKYLPDYLLTYGKYWNEQINIPLKKVVIGNPNYSENIKELNFNRKNENKKRILIISNNEIFYMMKKIAIELNVLLDKKNYDIVFRPHPGDFYEKRDSNFVFFKTKGIKIDTETDVYKSLKDTDFLIGKNSTVLYEAIGICKSIFMIKHPFLLRNMNIPKCIKRFSNSKELAYFIQNDNPEENKIINTNYIWEPNWENNYRYFINGLLNL